MAKGRTKREQNEYVWVHYGIHAPTKRVVQVWQTRAGKLQSSLDGFDNKFSYIGPGRDARTELIIIFGLSDTFSVPMSQVDADYTQRKIEELEAKAAAMKAEKDPTR